MSNQQPGSHSQSTQDFLESLLPDDSVDDLLLDGLQSNAEAARLLKNLLSLCVKKGILTNEEYFTKLRAYGAKS